ncbi:hypothetical protein MES5069_670013 [Mesorhizobium escarrei]|uniref:Uncharacterized protein n=1 Tax=Mesorhizobium escarrei TaxID=666018 RepID=A0ABN8KDG3_9HYPH|nr:hypothetical protein MES5069_670013 [Mesorhizobium escarrei]
MSIQGGIVEHDWRFGLASEVDEGLLERLSVSLGKARIAMIREVGQKARSSFTGQLSAVGAPASHGSTATSRFIFVGCRRDRIYIKRLDHQGQAKPQNLSATLVPDIHDELLPIGTFQFVLCQLSQSFDGCIARCLNPLAFQTRVVFHEMLVIAAIKEKSWHIGFRHQNATSGSFWCR